MATAVGRGGKRGLQFVGPGRGNGADPGFQRSTLDDGRFAFIAPDDVMDARQRAFGEGRVGGREGPFVDLGQEGGDARAHVGVVFLARNEDEDRDEAVEFVDPRQRPDAGALIQHQDFHHEVVEGVDVDLEQFVTRIFFEDVCQRLARMAARVEAGALEDQRYLVADPKTSLRAETNGYIQELTALLEKQEQIERERRKPAWRKPWFWGLVGGGVALVATGLGLGLGLGLRDTRTVITLQP